jgi:Ca2+-binding RTX toxin-like protein
MWGGLGNDTLDGGADNDLVMGGDGNDTLFGAAGDDEVNGGAGADILDGGVGADKMFGGVGNDTIWGGDGNDIMLGFTPTNDTKQTLAFGETDNDVMYGGAGDDLMLGGLGDDQLWAGVGADELQGGSGNDALYGEAGNDRLFGGAGNDTMYGGNGDDLIFGGVATNEAALATGTADSNFLYGGAGNDTIVGGIGNDYVDGGAGADNMQGGKGDDSYIVNSVNDVILEQAGEGYDSVTSSSNYILNANIEELRLVEGFNINGTGNSLNNRILGNSQDNILDGVTGADIAIGGLGNDTYYVDNVGDQVIEYAGEGTDAVNASISHTLGTHVENLTLLDFSKAEKGIADGTNILVYGYPKAFELDYMQGNAVAGYKGTCALTSIANLATQANQALTEAQVVQRAIDNQWAVTSSTATDYQRGGSNYIGQQALLNSYGIRNGIVMGYNEQAIANLIKGGRGVIIGLNAGKLWGDSAYLDNGGVNHVVTVTGVACDATTGSINGFYIADSGRGLVSDMTRYISIVDFRSQANVANAYSIYTIEPIKLWEESINATGNELANAITGNRGDNVIKGGLGNDTLTGQAGNDTYQFAKGDGQDTIVESDATAGNLDVLQLTNVNQTNLWFKKMGSDLQINVLGTTDQILVKDWYVAGTTGTDNQIERIKTADGLTMYNTDVETFVQAMAAFAPPSAAQTSWTSGQSSNGKVLLAVSH